MGEMNFLRHLEIAAFADSNGCRCPFANSVHREDDGLLKKVRVKMLKLRDFDDAQKTAVYFANRNPHQRL